MGEWVSGWRQRKQAKDATMAAALCSRQYVHVHYVCGCARASWAGMRAKCREYCKYHSIAFIGKYVCTYIRRLQCRWSAGPARRMGMYTTETASALVADATTADTPSPAVGVALPSCRYSLLASRYHRGHTTSVDSARRSPCSLPAQGSYHETGRKTRRSRNVM